LSEQGMARIFRDYADERWAARIAKFVVERRSARPYAVSGDLVDTVRAAVPAAARSKEIHPATRVYQALRIAVNDEFEVLESGLEQAIRLLRSGVRARIAVISYHSGEDRVVKRAFATHSGHCVCPPSLPMCVCGASDPALELLTKKPVVAGPDEVRRNPRSRSAKLRVAQKL
jgi:16S rRNA (cytosine1402-N4)-methyltransferase